MHMHLYFEEALYYFSQCMYHFTFPWVMHKGSSYSKCSSILLCSIFLNYIHHRGIEWYLMKILICIYLITNDVEHIFHIFIGHLYIFLEISIQVHGPFFNCFVLFLVVGVLYIFWILIPYQIYNLQIFLPFSKLSFRFLDSILWYAKVLNFDKVQFIYIYFVACSFGVSLHEHEMFSYLFRSSWFQ